MMFVPNQYYYPYNTFNAYPQFTPINMVSPEAPQRARFTKAEDELLKQLVDSQDQPNWNEIAIHMKHRTARQCRERYNNYLRPNLINGPWTHEEDELLLDLYEKYGPKWALISQNFTSRSPVNIKNHHSSLVSQSVVKNRKNHMIENNKEFSPIIEPTNNELQTPNTFTPSIEPVVEQKVEQSVEPSVEQNVINDDNNNNGQCLDNMFSSIQFGDDDLWSSTIVPSNDSDLLAF